MSKEKQSQIKTTVIMPSVGFKKTMYFNRFRVEKDAGFSTLHFGLVSATGLLLDRYSCVATNVALEKNQESLLKYYAQIGEPKQKPVPAADLFPKEGVDVLDVIGMAVRDNIAETRFFVISLSSILKDTTEIQSQPLALLRSEPELQKQLLKALYEE